MFVPTTGEYTIKAPQERPKPHAAVIEILDRHTGEKYGYTGAESVILPNFVRIDGVAVWCTYENPVKVEAVTIDGGTVPFAVTMSLLARAIRVGGAPAYDAGALGGAENMSCAVVEIPDVDELTPGEELDRPYVLLNGSPVYVQGGITVGELSTSMNEAAAAQVTLTLLCRRLIVDDEPFEGRSRGPIDSPA